MGKLSLASASLNFGSIVIGSSKALTVKASNQGSDPITVSRADFSNGAFSLTEPALPAIIAAGQSENLSLMFTPSAAGSFTATLTVSSNASDSKVNLSLSGTGVPKGQLTSNPSSGAFGNVTMGNQKSLKETVTNTGGTDVTISQATVSGSGFTLSGIPTPATLSAGESATFTLTFIPKAAGAASGSLTLTSNAANPTLTIPLTAAGIAPGQLASNPSSQAFGSVIVGSHQTLSGVLSNTGGTSVTLSDAAVSGTGFTLAGIAAPLTLAPGANATFTVTFSPGSTGAATGSVTFTSNASNPALTIALSGTGIAEGQLAGSPSSRGFGSVTLGNQESFSEAVMNTGGTSVTVSQVSVSGPGFSLNGITAPLTLTAGQSITFTVAFAPQAAGAANGSVTLTSTASNGMLTIPLSGAGIAPPPGQLTIAPATLALGDVVLGSSGSASGTVRASGGSITVTAASTNNPAFGVGGLSLPLTLSAGASLPFTVTFSPQAAGSASATLTITSNAQPSAATEALTGTGTPAPTHVVDLSWTASASTDVASYNIYRALDSNSSCSAFSKINSFPNASTLYTDNSVATGASYCYAVTAVDSSNVESSFSNVVSNVRIQ